MENIVVESKLQNIYNSTLLWIWFMIYKFMENIVVESKLQNIYDSTLLWIWFIIFRLPLLFTDKRSPTNLSYFFLFYS